MATSVTTCPVSKYATSPPITSTYAGAADSMIMYVATVVATPNNASAASTAKNARAANILS